MPNARKDEPIRHERKMNTSFLYIDILGFRELTESKSEKIPLIFSTINKLKVHRHFAFKTIMFSDTILVFNQDTSRTQDYYFTYLVEFTQELFYNLGSLNIFFRAIITSGEFKYEKLKNIESYYGKALIECYDAEKNIKAIGLFVKKEFSDNIITFDTSAFSENYLFIHLCQSLTRLYRDTNGILPIDINILAETDDYFRIDEDLRFLREIEFLKKHHKIESVRNKYEITYNQYKKYLPNFFISFEEQGFLPTTINENYHGHINPFELLSEEEEIN